LGKSVSRLGKVRLPTWESPSPDLGKSVSRLGSRRILSPAFAKSGSMIKLTLIPFDTISEYTLKSFEFIPSHPKFINKCPQPVVQLVGTVRVGTHVDQDDGPVKPQPVVSFKIQQPGKQFIR
jgi:hypothetical protein